MEIKETNNDDLPILIDFAKRTRREIVFEEKPYPTYYGNRLQKFKTTLHIRSNVDPLVYFVCFWDPFLKIGKYTNFSGIFLPVSASTHESYLGRQKNFFDKFSLLLKNEVVTTASDEFNSKVLIKGKNRTMVPGIFNNTKAQKLFIEGLDIKSPLFFGINEVNIDFVPGYKGASHFGIYSKQEWFLDTDQIEKLFSIGEKIRKLSTYLT